MDVHSTSLIFYNNTINSFLLAKENRNNFGNINTQIHPIGGKIEDHDNSDPFRCAVREFVEETGFRYLNRRIYKRRDYSDDEYHINTIESLISLIDNKKGYYDITIGKDDNVKKHRFYIVKLEDLNDNLSESIKKFNYLIHNKSENKVLENIIWISKHGNKYYDNRGREIRVNISSLTETFFNSISE